MDPASLFKALSGPTRLRCISLLISQDELCVCELTHALALPQPKISHHLAALRKADLVTDRKEGLWIYYQINPDTPSWALNVMHTTVNSIRQKQPYASDTQALKEMPNRPSGICSA
ncbi:MAG: metalloregulator ArsR/SmtB family transcription factor [Gammaproteobacteria bacterium]|nr:metalloregulator ArsR/SmtB family transcription factor [Gammaproteobacteria bacterium]